MSIGRRLTRLIRSQLGALRGDPFDGETESVRDRTDDRRSGDTQGPDIPFDVVKAYRALEVPVGSDLDTVKRGYRRMMKRYHQDRFDTDEEKREVAGTVSKRLNAAYERILVHLGES